LGSVERPRSCPKPLGRSGARSVCRLDGIGKPREAQQAAAPVGGRDLDGLEMLWIAGNWYRAIDIFE
jgi:hypothetical protein